MYYEERIKDGLLYWRGTPDGEFVLMDYDTLNERYQRLREAAQWVLDDAAYKPPEIIGDIAERWIHRLRASV